MTDGRAQNSLPNLADEGVKGEANEEVDEETGVHLKQPVLRQREMAREQEVDHIAEQDGEQGLEKV
jgi:hypothetical protein